MPKVRAKPLVVTIGKVVMTKEVKSVKEREAFQKDLIDHLNALGADKS